MERLKSRKLWVTIIAAALVTLGDQFGIVLETESLIAVATMVIAYITGQAVVDKNKVAAEVQSQIPAMMSSLETALAAVAASEQWSIQNKQGTTGS